MAESTYNWGQVAQHNSESDMWIVVGDHVYDVTQYSLEHPGGPIVLQNKAGRDATNAFAQASHSETARHEIMPKYRIGRINRDSPMEEWQREPQASSPNMLVTVAIVAAILALIYFLAA